MALKLTDRGAYCVDETCVDAADGSEDAACAAASGVCDADNSGLDQLDAAGYSAFLDGAACGTVGCGFVPTHARTTNPAAYTYHPPATVDTILPPITNVYLQVTLVGTIDGKFNDFKDAFTAEVACEIGAGGVSGCEAGKAAVNVMTAQEVEAEEAGSFNTLVRFYVSDLPPPVSYTADRASLERQLREAIGRPRRGPSGILPSPILFYTGNPYGCKKYRWRMTARPRMFSQAARRPCSPGSRWSAPTWTRSRCVIISFNL